MNSSNNMVGFVAHQHHFSFQKPQTKHLVGSSQLQLIAEETYKHRVNTDPSSNHAKKQGEKRLVKPQVMRTSGGDGPILASDLLDEGCINEGIVYVDGGVGLKQMSPLSLSSYPYGKVQQPDFIAKAKQFLNNNDSTL